MIEKLGIYQGKDGIWDSTKCEMLELLLEIADCEATLYPLHLAQKAKDIIEKGTELTWEEVRRML